MSRCGSNRRLLKVEVAALLFIVALAEFGVRYSVSRPGSEFFPQVFPWPLTTAKYMAFRDLDDSVDVLLMGMSQMMRVHAGKLGEILSSSKEARTVFNFAAPLHTVEFDRRLLMDVLVPMRRPKVVVYGLIPTIVPMESSAEETAGKIAPIGVFFSYSRTPAALLRRFVWEDFDLFLYRDSVVRALRDQPDPQAFWRKMARSVDRHGDTPLPPESFIDPTQVGAIELRHVGRLLRNFPKRLETTPLFANLTSLARDCRARGIRLVVVENPVNRIYLDMLENGAADYRRFLAHVEAAADAEGVPVFRPMRDGLGEPELYIDATHHNAAGMAWLTGEIGNFLLESRILDGVAASSGKQFEGQRS